MTKPFQVRITFQVTDEIVIDASSPDEAIRRALEDADRRCRAGERFVWADAEPSENRAE